MDNYPHIIRQQIFEINISSRDKGREIQDRISSIVNNQLIYEIDRIFERLVPENRLIRAENITVDVGVIPLDALDTDLTSRIIEKLEEQLRVLLLHDNSAVPIHNDTNDSRPHSSYLKLLEYFLQKGSCPLQLD